MKTTNEKKTNSLNENGLTSLLQTCDVATLLGIGAKTVHKLVREGKLPCVQVTTRERRFTPEQVQLYIESQSTGIRVDKKAAPAVSSRPKKGGAKSSGVLSRQALLEEMRKCQ
ncbi:MAG: helix-turn-helix domain-containing protein [Desulfomonilaceae bacterium]